MITVRSVVLSLAVLLITTVPTALAQGTYTQIDVPGAIATFAYGINSLGNLTGWYVDASFRHHGFLFSSGSYTTIDYPGAMDAQFYGMNDIGQLVGSTAVPFIGFSYNIQTETFTTIAFPNAINTFPTAINNSGKVAGYFAAHSGQFGFALIGSQYRRVGPKGASNSILTGVTDSGKLMGYVYSHAGTYLNFVFKTGEYHEVTIPNVPGAVVTSANPAGTQLVGVYLPGSGTVAGFLRQGRMLQTLQFPGSDETYAYGVNALGTVVGVFVDSSGIQHGFVWTPPADSHRD